MISLFDLLLFGVLGLLAGTLSGLFGIGGGMVIVPGLFYLFRIIDLPSNVPMHLAAGSAMCIMIFTSAASAWFHHAKGDVQWSIFWRIIPAIGLGVLLGKLLAKSLNTYVLEWVFGLFLVFVSLKLLLSWTPQPEQPNEPGHWLTQVVGTVLGFKSGVLGIGGGAISVPFLLYAGLPMSQASGTSASFTLPIAVVGTVSSLLLPIEGAIVPWATGTVYWPAVLLVAPFTLLGAPLGTRLCHIVPSQRLKLWFATFLMFLGLRLLVEAWL